MRHAKALKLLVGPLCLVAGALVACGSMEADAAFSEKSAPNGGSSTSSGSSSGGSKSPEASGVADYGSPAATGVVIAHSAFFPSLRLCFQNYPDKLPQPDSKVMPAANVVGVEIGSAVRIDALPDAPGQVYVIDEVAIRQQSGSAEALSCGQLIGEIGGPAPATNIKRNNAYYLATTVDQPLGVTNVDVLAISGCGDQATVDNLDGVPVGQKADVRSCGTPWDGTTGNLAANVIRLTPSTDGPTDSDIPVQLFDLAPAVTALNGKADVKFGPQVGDGDTVALQAGTLQRVKVDQTKDDSYGRFGFQVTATIDGKQIVTRQTLADVQQLSSPGDVPTTYYRVASNYALLLIGDPNHPEKRDGGANPAFNPRRALHILAVPVLDPAKLADAGADAEAGPPVISP